MNRKIIVLLMLLICALSVSTVSAEDGDAVSANFTDLQAAIDDGGDSVDLTSNYAKNTSESYVTISRNMTINGNNHVIDGSKGNAFVIGANSSVTINDLTFINSVRPVFNYGNVILNNCTFIDNNGAVSSSSGSTLEVRDCRFINNTRTAQYAMGGAISATGATVKISGSSFINNSATNGDSDDRFAFGGAVFVQGGTDLTVVNSTFSANRANSKNNNAQGGAIFAWGDLQKVSVENSTFTGNSAINGGAIYTDAYTDLSVRNSEFTDNSAIDDTAVGSGGAIFSEGNLEVDGSTFADNTATNGGAIYGASASGKNIAIGDSKFDGNTATHVDGTKGGEGGAILLLGSAESSISGCTFENNDAKYYGGALWTKFEIALEGCNFKNNTADCGGAVYTKGSLTAGDCNFTDNTGSAIYSSGSVTAEGCTFTGNTAETTGGAIFTTASVTADGCTFTGNTARNNGGAIYSTASVTAENCTFTGNTAQVGGGGGAIIGSSVTAVDSTFTGNTAYMGGAVVADSIAAENCTFKDNTARTDGGALYGGSNVAAADCTFTGNTAYSTGGAVISDHVIAENCNFTGNAAQGNGGAIRFWKSMGAENCTFADNSAQANGGAVYTSNGDATAENCTFTGNSAENGGAIYSDNNVTVADCTFTGNTANIDGGAIYSDNNVTVADCTFIGNIAEANGSAIYGNGNGSVSDCLFKGNYMDPNDIVVYNVAKVTGSNIEETGSGSRNWVEIDLSYALEATDLVKHFNNGTQYTVKVTDSKGNPVAGQTVALTLTNPAWNAPVTYYKVTDEKGVATLPIGLYAGTYGITAAVGDDSVETTITVLPMTYSLESEDIYMTFRDGTNYTVTVIDADSNPAAGKTVAITISSPKWKGPVTYKKVTDENGIATLPIGLSVGKYDVTATFDGESASTTINVLKSAYRIETDDVVKYFNNGTQYGVTVRDLQDNPVEGKTVSVTVNSAKWKTPVTYNITTDENGIATLPIGLVAGEYTISANVDGNIAENSITVLPVLTTESISKPVNQPASLLAKLVDGQGNPAAGKTVTFTVKTKSYDRLTDEKGIAALPIGLGIGKWTIMVSDPETGAKASATVTVTKAIS